MEYLTSNVVMLKWMIAEGYGDRRTLERRVARMEAWLEAPDLLEADAKEYFETIDVNMDELTEPILCAPNDPDDARSLSTVQNEKIDEVFIGSCTTRHFRAAGKMVGCHVLQLSTPSATHTHPPPPPRRAAAAAAAQPSPSPPPPPPTPPSPSPLSACLPRRERSALADL